MDNSQYYTPGGNQHQATNPPNMENNFAPRGGPYYPSPSVGFPPTPYQPPRTAVQGNVDNSSRPNFWTGPNVYQPTQPQNAPPWPPFPPLPGPGNAGYGYPQPQYQTPPGFEGHPCPPNPPPFEFNPSRPPPVFCEPESNQVSAFIEAQRNACSVSQQPGFESHNVGVSNQWAPGPTAGHQNNRDNNRSFNNTRNFANTEFQTAEEINRRDNERCQRGFNDYFNEPQPNQQRYQPLEHAQPDEESRQRKQDEQWLQNFALKRKIKTIPQKSRTEMPSVSQMKEDLYGAVKLVSELSLICQTLKLNLENDTVWTESYSEAAELKKNVQERLSFLSDPEAKSSIKKKLMTIRNKRIRIRRKKIEHVEEDQKQEERLAERVAAIDKWMLKRIQQVEEKKRVRWLRKRQFTADGAMSQ